MAEYFADTSAVGNEYQAYADAMTWGALATDKPLPQDGNGKAGPGHSAAVAIAEVRITVLPANTNTLTIAGAVLTAATTAAAKNQWTISASIATCVTNLVALLNTFGTGTAQCDAAVSTTACKLALALPYWCRARVKPGTTDTVQIATRIAGTDLNHAVNSAVAISSSGWATPPTLTQFAGGADGPFAYLMNTATVFGKSAGLTGTAGPAYGLFFAASPAPDEPGASDVVHCRTRRSGSNLTVSWANSGTPTATWRQRNYLADNGTIWSGDNGTLTLNFRNTNGSSTQGSFGINVSQTVRFDSRSKYGFEIYVGTTLSGSGNFTLFAPGSNSIFGAKNTLFGETADNIRNNTFFGNGFSLSAPVADLADCFFLFRGTAKTLLNFGNSTLVRVSLHGSTVEVVAATGSIGKFVLVNGAGATGAVEWLGGEVRDSLGVYSCPMPFDVSTGTASAIDSLIDGVIGVTDPSVGYLPSSSGRSRLRWNQPEGPNKGFRSETPMYSIDWKGDGTFPYADAADLRGNGWSHRLTWNAVPTMSISVTPLRMARFYRGTAAVKTISAELFVPTATTVYLDEIEFTVSYMDSGNVWRTEAVGGVRSQQLAASRVALPSSTVTWTGGSGLAAKKLELTTSQPIKSGSEVIMRLSLCASRPSAITMYVSPEPRFV